MVPFALDFDNIFNSNLDKESEKGYDIMRQMANMKEVPLPSAATPKIDLKTAAIGSIIAGILGNAEGAGGFLQGLIQGNEAKRQQMDQESARKFQMQKMAQDRELGIMKTEAEIANQKANRLLSRQEQFQRRVDEEKKLAREALTNRRIAISQAFGRVQNPEDVDTIKAELSLQGIELTPEDEEMLGGVRVAAQRRLDKANEIKQASGKFKLFQMFGKQHSDIMKLDGKITKEEADTYNSAFRMLEKNEELPAMSFGVLTPQITTKGQEIAETKRWHDERLKVDMEKVAIAWKNADTAVQRANALAAYYGGSLTQAAQRISLAERSQLVGGLRDQLKTLSAQTNQLRQRVQSQQSNLLKAKTPEDVKRIKEDLEGLGEAIKQTKEKYNNIGGMLQSVASAPALTGPIGAVPDQNRKPTNKPPVVRPGSNKPLAVKPPPGWNIIR